MKGKLVTPYIGKALLAGTWVHHAGADRLSVLSVLSDTLVMLFVTLLMHRPKARQLKLSRERMQHVAMLFHLAKMFSLCNAYC